MTKQHAVRVKITDYIPSDGENGKLLRAARHHAVA